MRIKELSNDDLQDVTEMTTKIEEALSEILAGNEADLAFSALVSGTINCLLCQCRTLDEYKRYKEFFIQILNDIPTISGLSE